MTALTPAEAWAQLEAGNKRFVDGRAEHPHQDAARRAELEGSQAPFATVFNCSDSRVSSETLFDLGLGDAFVVRNAGQVISESALGTIEYAVALLHTPVLVVMSHQNCGAIRAAIDSSTPDADRLPPHIADVIAPIMPAVQRAVGAAGAQVDAAPIDAAQIDATEVAREHVQGTIGELLRRSEIVAQAVADGELAIVGCHYRLSDGAVTSHVVIGEV
ncbi:carbonic anhydrase [Humibacter albus]|uniref:carbonic anhydrase n=1 Tax=Humibacter albus TaxID=427754 RepID=UPI0003B2F564|nr:carbonic anhydrase [Humibacter albus]